MTDESGEAKPVDGAPASAPAAPAPPVPAPVRIDVIPSAQAPAAADPSILPEVPPAAVTVTVGPTPVVEVTAPETPDAPIAEATPLTMDVPAATTAPEPMAEVAAETPVEATPPATEVAPPIAVATDGAASVGDLPVSEPIVEPSPAEVEFSATEPRLEPPALAEPTAEPPPIEAGPAAAEPPAEPTAPAEPQSELVPVPSTPSPPIVREGLSILPMLEFTAWRLLELVATVVTTSLIIGLLLPGEGTADAVVLIERLAVTVPLVMLALLVAVIIGLPIGYAAARVGSWLDVVLRALTTLGVSLNPIWLAMLLVLLFALTLQWVQPGGFVPWQQSPLAAVTSLILPALALGVPLGAEVASRLRDSFAAVLKGPAMRTAEVMGLSRGEAIRDHAWRRALADLFGQTGIPLAMLVPMSLVVEAVFYLPGLGRQIFTALADRDFAALQLGLVTLIALVSLCRFLGRMLEAWFDPRLARRA